MSISSLFVSARALVVFVAFTFFASSQASAAIIADFDIGIGANLASIQIDQEDGDAIYSMFDGTVRITQVGMLLSPSMPLCQHCR